MYRSFDINFLAKFSAKRTGERTDGRTDGGTKFLEGSVKKTFYTLIVDATVQKRRYFKASLKEKQNKPEFRFGSTTPNRICPTM